MRTTTEDVERIGQLVTDKLNYLLKARQAKPNCPSHLMNSIYVYDVRYGIFLKTQGSRGVGQQITNTYGVSKQAFETLRLLSQTIDFATAAYTTNDILFTDYWQ